MIIKNIFNVKNYKGLEDGFKVQFDDITYIVGDNAKNKTTIGSLPLWIFTGYNLYGGNRETVANDNNMRSLNTYASMTIIDNDGTEHTITRCKGKENYVMLDGIKTTQEILARFYKDIHAFICAYNPYYFRSMELAKQRELLLKILPPISPKDSFDLLEQTEKEVIGKPIEKDIKDYCKLKRSEIKELKSDLDKLIGSKNTYIEIALQKEDNLKIFDKQRELTELENEYEMLISNTENIISIEDLEKEIKSIDQKISQNINDDLQELKKRHNKELENLNSVSSVTSNCPTCKQPIKNENLIKALTITYKKNVDNAVQKMKELKSETEELIRDKDTKIKQYKEMKTPEMQEKTNRRNILKEQIDLLQKEKTEINLFNKEATIKHNQIIKAKQQIQALDKECQEIRDTIDKFSKQIKIAQKLHSLMIDKQMESVKRYLNNVTIKFYEIDEQTEEMIDTYEIRYKGRLYEKLSKSYKLRADIEIARLINKVAGIDTPMFIDDIESITQINFSPDIQVILAMVIKYNELEILYSYQEVLQREKVSINKKIEASCNLLQNAA